METFGTRKTTSTGNGNLGVVGPEGDWVWEEEGGRKIHPLTLSILGRRS